MGCERKTSLSPTLPPSDSLYCRPIRSERVKETRVVLFLHVAFTLGLGIGNSRGYLPGRAWKLSHT